MSSEEKTSTKQSVREPVIDKIWIHVTNLDIVPENQLCRSI